MGSLTARPRISTGASTNATTVTQPLPHISTSPPEESADTSAAQTTGTESESADIHMARSLSLLSRDRGRLGTILTGFRGLLSQSNQNNGRKTLLGE
jgi:hypothetical protein